MHDPGQLPELSLHPSQHQSLPSVCLSNVGDFKIDKFDDIASITDSGRVVSWNVSVNNSVWFLSDLKFFDQYVVTESMSEKRCA